MASKEQRAFLRSLWANNLAITSYAAGGLRTGSVIAFAREDDQTVIRAFEQALAIRLSWQDPNEQETAARLSENMQIAIENLPMIMNAAAPYLLPELLGNFHSMKLQVENLKNIPGWEARAKALAAALGKATPPIFQDHDLFAGLRTIWPWRPVVADIYRRDKTKGALAENWEVASRGWDNEARFGALATAAQLRGVEKILALETIPGGMMACLERAPQDARGLWMARCALEILPAKHHPAIITVAKKIWTEYQPTLAPDTMRQQKIMAEEVLRSGPIDLQRILNPALPPAPQSLIGKILDLWRGRARP
jgi:hypothetical protein